MLWIKGLLKNEKAQSMVEFALILPIIILLLFGILEFGRIYYSQIVLVRTAREAVRMCALGKSDQEVIDKIFEITSLPDTMENLRVEEILPPEGERKTGDAVTVKISYKLPLITPFFFSSPANLLTLKAQATMRME